MECGGVVVFFWVFLSRLAATSYSMVLGWWVGPTCFSALMLLFLLPTGLDSFLPAVTNGLDPLKMRFHTLAIPRGRDMFEMEGSGLYSSHLGIC